MPPKKAQSDKLCYDNYDDENYDRTREKRNQAVKRCREKARNKANETKFRVECMKVKNLRLEEKIKCTKKNVNYLKNLLLQATNLPEEYKTAVERIADDEMPCEGT